VPFSIKWVEDLSLAAMADGEDLGDDPALDADVESGDLLVNDEAGELFVHGNARQELVLTLGGFPVLKTRKTPQDWLIDVGMTVINSLIFCFLDQQFD